MAVTFRSAVNRVSCVAAVQLLAVCSFLCWVTYTLEFNLGLIPGYLSHAPISVLVLLGSVGLGFLAVCWLRLCGHFSCAPLRSISEQRTVCFICSWVFLTAVVELAALLAPMASDAAHINPLSLGLTFARSGVVALVAGLSWLACSMSPALDRFVTRRIRVVTDASQEDLARIAWHLSQRDLRQDVDIVPLKSGFKWDDRGAFEHCSFMVVSQGFVSMSERALPSMTAYLNGVPVIDVEHFISLISRRIDVTRVDVTSLLSAAPAPSMRRTVYEFVKEMVEPAMALVLAVLLSPVLVVVAVLVRLSSPGPVIYRQIRSGRFGRDFMLLKFRTMHTDAEAAGPQWSSSSDSRVTKVGKFLRATRLDELPQLWNVITGKLSFIGPRPERPEIISRLVEQIPAFPLRTAMRPGITGWAQVRAGYAASIDESVTKLEHDLYYALYSSFFMDFEIIARTLVVGVLGDRQEVVHAQRIPAQRRASEEAQATVLQAVSN